MFEWTDLKAVTPMASIVAALVSVSVSWFVNSRYRAVDKKWEEYKERIIDPIRIDLKELKKNRVEIRRFAYGELNIYIKNETINNIINNIGVHLTEIEYICSRADQDPSTQEQSWEHLAAKQSEELHYIIHEFLENRNQINSQEDGKYFDILRKLISQLEIYENGIEELIRQKWDKNYLNFYNVLVRKIKSKKLDSQAQI